MSVSAIAEQDSAVRPQRVALVNMPFAGAERPSIQCGLLKAELASAGHRVDVHYLNLELAAELGRELYDGVAALRSDDLLGEWLFSTAAFGHRGDEDAYRRAHGGRRAGVFPHGGGGGAPGRDGVPAPERHARQGRTGDGLDVQVVSTRRSGGPPAGPGAV
jgi:hypothetical protein